jgi:hypothetical protein
MWLHGWLCLELAEFMVMWRWQNALPNEFLNWSLKMLLLMCYSQTSMLLLAAGISVGMLSSRESKTTPRSLKLMHNRRGCQESCMMWGRCLIQNLFCMMWKKKNKCFICVTIARNYLLHLGSSTQLPVLLSESEKICRFVKLATLPQISSQK